MNKKKIFIACDTGDPEKLKKIISQYCKDNKDNSIILHSQVSVENFYKNLNFNSYGNQFTEDGILHIAMKYLS